MRSFYNILICLNKELTKLHFGWITNCDKVRYLPETEISKSNHGYE